VYNNFGNISQTKVENQVLSTKNYVANNGNLTSEVYSNNHTISYLYDRFNRTTQKTGTDGTHQYTYDAKSNLGIYKDNVNNETTNYTYDLAERPVQTQNTNGFKTQYGYDENSNVNNIKYTLNTILNEVKLTFDKDNRINNININNNTATVITNYDSLSRINNKQLKVSTNTYTVGHTYEDLGNNRTTTSLESITNGTNDAISYTYDVLGNIETITEGNTLKATYYYDEISQLIREDNVYLNKTITYEWDLRRKLNN